ncbi:Lyso-phosphatidylcholine acyltransferase [Elasticomyces elasticus]|nr:Lyso-phosphatidylcholine acyltransferase [Elasticomyces elasticus]
MPSADPSASPVPPWQPSWPWRASSTIVVGITGFLCRSFIYGLNRTEVQGLDNLLRVIDERNEVDRRQRGLVTVSNHISVMDDPLVWGALPLRYHWNASNMRWGLGSYDICFKNKFSSTFFTLGQVLPTHRNAHSTHGGLFQPTIVQAIRLLSDPQAGTGSSPESRVASSAVASTHASPPDHSLSSPDLTDPFSSNHLTYSTNGTDTFPAPAAYASRKHSWVHIFPEGKIHQKSDKTMRYFKWGVARLILESEPCPDVLPIWLEGFDQCLHESRGWPRAIPRSGANISITFGEKVDMESRFGDLRERWKMIKESALREGGGKRTSAVSEIGVLEDEELKYGAEAVELRKEVTLRVRQEVLEVRKSRGLPDEDPKAGLVETWRAEGGLGKTEGRMDDGSWVRDT